MGRGGRRRPQALQVSRGAHASSTESRRSRAKSRPGTHRHGVLGAGGFTAPARDAGARV